MSEVLTRTLAHSLTILATMHPVKNLRYIIYLGVLYHVWSQKQETNMKDTWIEETRKVTHVAIYDYTLIRTRNESQNN